jgi:hypothetical protein
VEIYVAQAWKTIRGQSTVQSINQDEPSYVDLCEHQDVVAWLQVSEVNAGGGTNVTIAYQTSATRDEALFQTMTGLAGPVPVTVAVGVTVTPIVIGATFNSLARWFRWQLAVTGSPTSAWDLTFRLYLAANLTPKARRRMSATRQPLPPTRASSYASALPRTQSLERASSFFLGRAGRPTGAR